MALDFIRAARTLHRGLGWPTILTAPAPAAGAEAAITITGGLAVVPLSFRVPFTASAVAANRRPNLTVSVGGRDLLGVPSAGTVTATQAWTLWWLTDQGASINDSNSFVQDGVWPRVVLLPGWQLITRTSLIDVGDAYGAPRLFGLALPWGGPSAED